MYQNFLQRGLFWGVAGVTKLSIRRTIRRRRSICVSYDGGGMYQQKFATLAISGVGHMSSGRGKASDKLESAEFKS